jgi:hypothetical protein
MYAILWMRSASVLILVAVAALSGGYPGVAADGPEPSPLRYEQEIRSDPPERLHILRVDLTDPRVELRAVPGGDDPDGPGPWQTVLQRPSEIARAAGLDAAINANGFGPRDARMIFGRRVPYFPGNWTIIAGFCVSDGRLVSAQPNNASMVIDGANHIWIGRLDKLPAGARQIVSGPQVLVHDGRNVATPTAVAPSTSAGVDATGHELVLLVIDGRRPDYSAGMDAPQRAQEMIRLGCTEAIDFDGGGSSAMVIGPAVAGYPLPLVPSATMTATTGPAPSLGSATGNPTGKASGSASGTPPGGIRVVNRPSDGHDLPLPLSIERPVAVVLGIRLRR